ncbi:MAG: site-specific integrase, partial [Cetobacterium sp.]
INKSYQRIKGEDVVTEPKTPKSKRVIEISDFLLEIIKEYIDKLYEPTPDTRLFNSTKHRFEHDMKLYSGKAGLHRIRIHDLRHSHASFLINNNVNILAVSQRLGHEKIETTLNIYSHLYKESHDYMMNILNNKD